MDRVDWWDGFGWYALLASLLEPLFLVLQLAASSYALELAVRFSAEREGATSGS
ncbi:hypothetical protein [Streptomyces sp. YGL11-2]|uniref:hypothetical protein n=1 Tax=Streptomyces sp. YGL11-2 TaxID=3414028 RepID=UPI003CF897BF